VNGSDTTAAVGVGRRPRERAWVVAAVLVAAVGTAGYTGWRHYARPVDGRYKTVVALLAGGPSALPPTDYRGRIDLAAHFAGLTPHDEMFVVRRDDGSFLALFPTFYGNGTTLAGLLYASRPLGEADTYIRQATMGQAQRVIDVGAYHHMDFDRRIDDHWYQVSYGMH
jgi:hypothetical protein